MRAFSKHRKRQARRYSNGYTVAGSIDSNTRDGAGGNVHRRTQTGRSFPLAICVTLFKTMLTVSNGKRKEKENKLDDKLQTRR